jgi:hypothetical protein
VRTLRALAIAAAVAAVIWIVGGPAGAALNAPGLLLLAAAAKSRILPGSPEPGLGRWILLGTIVSAAFWAVAAWVALGFVARSGNRAGDPPAD